MIGALGTLFCFALTPVFARRAALLLGSLEANFWRLLVAVLLLGAWAHGLGLGLGGVAFWWFFVGGLVGFGVGGVAMFQSLPRLGSNLSTLIVQCGSAIIAATVEWLWLGTQLSPTQLACGALTLGGITLGLLPRSLPRVAPADWAEGVGWAVLSAFGQGIGAVISRKAFATAGAWHQLVDPGTAAYQRALGGLLFGAIFVLALRGRQRGPQPPQGRAWPWVLGNALTGPVLGVTSYQWALRTTPAGIVQPIVAAAPLLTIPFAARLEGSRPHLTYYVGALLAVAGVTGLVLWK
ncbi:MAG TPA: DMT family transporter [Opitutaceae bacterium]|nr:DMT family transporter [Opitutaceae bacterium]HND62993.1 DMT family transporter [Opitutaceae bacterium]